MKKYLARGRHILIDIRSEDLSIFRKKKSCKKFLEKIASHIGATSLKFSFHKFQPCGETAVLLLSESHISVHTYPDQKKAFLDVFTCGNIKPKKAIEVIENEIKVNRIAILEVERGSRDGF